MAKQYRHRYIKPAQPWDSELGPLQFFPGTWKSGPRGWNMIALPFDTATPFGFRVLMNQYRERLVFSIVDKNVPNRGIDQHPNPTQNTDQFLVTLDYQQSIDQIEVDDEPVTGEATRGPACDADCPPNDEDCLAIHHEPGLWLHMLDRRTNGLDIARLATIPHGNSVLALGKSEPINGAPQIPVLNGLPIGISQDLQNNPYLAAYKRFEDTPFKGTAINVPNFPGFFPTDMNAILRFANSGVDIDKTMILHVDTAEEQAGIVNIPFIEQQADAAAMTSTFWIHQLKELDDKGKPKLRMQYSQTVMLDFFEAPGGGGELIRWPHVSINTLDKISDEVLPVA